MLKLSKNNRIVLSFNLCNLIIEIKNKIIYLGVMKALNTLIYVHVNIIFNGHCLSFSVSDIYNTVKSMKMEPQEMTWM